MTPQYGQKLVQPATDKSMTGWPQDTTNAKTSIYRVLKLQDSNTTADPSSGTTAISKAPYLASSVYFAGILPVEKDTAFQKRY